MAVGLPPECEEYFEKYNELLERSGVPEEERARTIDSVRATFEQACVHEHARAALVEGMKHAIAQMEGAVKAAPPSRPPPPEGKHVTGELDALAPEDRAFVTFWNDTPHDRFAFRDLHRFTRPGGTVVDMEVGGYRVSVIDGYEETINPHSTGAITVRFWKTHNGLYFVQRSGGCIAYRNVLFGPFAAAGETFKEVEQ